MQPAATKLLSSINNYCKYNDVITPGVNVQHKTRPIPSSGNPALNNTAVKEDTPIPH